MEHYCAWCRETNPDIRKGGKYYCQCHKEYVSANTKNCPDWKETWRNRSTAEEMWKYSSDHGYYVMTAITKTLGLPEDNQYLILFKKLRDDILPNDKETEIQGITEGQKQKLISYEMLINQYEDIGPIIAEGLLSHPNAYDICKYYEEIFLKDFVKLMIQEKFTEAAILYFNIILPGIKTALRERVEENVEEQSESQRGNK